jgi:hypothetical protein
MARALIFPSRLDERTMASRPAESFAVVKQIQTLLTNYSRDEVEIVCRRWLQWTSWRIHQFVQLASLLTLVQTKGHSCSCTKHPNDWFSLLSMIGQFDTSSPIPTIAGCVVEDVFRAWCEAHTPSHGPQPPRDHCRVCTQSAYFLRDVTLNYDCKNYCDITKIDPN